MDSTEKIVRWGLAERERDKILEYFKDRPRFVERIDETSRKYKGKIEEAIDSSEVYLEEVSLDDLYEFDRIMSFDGVIEETGKSYLKTSEEFKEEIESKFEIPIFSDKLSQIPEIKDLYNLAKRGLEISRKSDSIVEEVKETAREKDLHEALGDKSAHSAFRTIFPDSGDYRKYKMESWEDVRLFFNSMKKMTKEVEKPNRSTEEFLDSIFEDIEDFIGKLNSMSVEISEREIEEIYR